MPNKTQSVITDNSFSISKKAGLQSQGLIAWFALFGVLILVGYLGRSYLVLKFGKIKNHISTKRTARKLKRRKS